MNDKENEEFVNIFYDKMQQIIRKYGISLIDQKGLCLLLETYHRIRIDENKFKTLKNVQKTDQK